MCACGWSSVITNDPDANISINTRDCPVCAGADLTSRVLATEDQKARKAATDPATPLPEDGRRIVSSLDPPTSP